MKLIAKVGMTSFLLTINAQLFDSAFDTLNVVGENSNTVSSYDPELADDLFDASGDVDEASVSLGEAPVGLTLEKRKFFVPGWTDTETHALTGKNMKKNKWKKSIKKNRKRIKTINSASSSPFGMLAALRAATKKKLFNAGKIATKFVDYGCWCFQSEDVSSFRLPSVDEYDTGCQSLVKCETCVAMDFAEDEKCAISETGYPEYNATITRAGTVECNNAAGTCQRAYCECHKNFAENFPNKVSGDRQFHASRFDKQPKGKNAADELTKKEEFCVVPKKTKPSSAGMDGRFDDDFRGLQLDGFFTTQSPKIKNEKPVKKDHCCGEYPARYPFSSFDGDHGCCGSQTYDKASKECCGSPIDGKIYNPFLKACCSKKNGGVVADFGTCLG